MAQASGYSPTGTIGNSTPSRATNRPSAQQVNKAKGTSESTSPFSHLPPYSPPQTPLFKALPEALIPYAELMRLHKPAGYYAFLFPHLIGSLLAASRGPVAPSVQSLTKIILAHAVANLFLRGAACSYNDALDGPFDRLAERCRHRPVARGAVSAFGAMVFAFAQGMIWITILTTLPPETVKPVILLGITMLVYPWCKRFANYPQVVLGFSLACGQSIGAGVVGWDIQKSRIAGMLNAIIYDTVYAYQDIQDDLKAGFMKVMLLATAGYAVGFQGACWLAPVSGTAVILKIEDRADCWYWFCHLIWLTGGTMCAGLAGEYAQKLLAL
ncbi:hypothetical protein GQ44DRAFT_743741 [Phaeosphaeriaceae sp. PMI808]|nr:hypothetical protein GQ44DRAFT_743741 [Phaeosphaeriaceae sp. PMI808]